MIIVFIGVWIFVVGTWWLVIGFVCLRRGFITCRVILLPLGRFIAIRFLAVIIVIVKFV